jgi:hypothetical protein
MEDHTTLHIIYNGKLYIKKYIPKGKTLVQIPDLEEEVSEKKAVLGLKIK